YASLLPDDAQSVIGKVGAQTRGVEKLLERIGFRYAWRVDPFDGGPHFTAPTDEVSLVRASHAARLTRLLPAGDHVKTRALVAAGGAELGAAAVKVLRVSENDSVWVLPLE